MHEIVLMGSSQRWGVSHVVQRVWLSALRMGHRTPDFALAALNKWDHLSGPAGSTLSNAAQDTTDLDHKNMLLVHAQFGVQQHPQVFFHQAIFPLSGFQHVLMPAFFPHQVQDMAFLIIELHEVPVVPFLQPTEVPLDGYRTLWHTSHSFQFGVDGKLDKGTLCPIIPAINEDVKQGWTLCVTPGVQSLDVALQTDSTDHQPVVPATKSGLKPHHCLLIQYLKQQLLYEDLKWDSVKGLPEVQADNVHCQSRQTMSISKALEMRLSFLGLTFQKIWFWADPH